MKRHEVIISHNAWDMLTEHVRFLSDLDPDAGDRLHLRIIKEIKSLAEFPERFPRVDPEDDTNLYRKMVVPNWYVILYTVKEDTVYVDYVIDGRQNYGWLIENK